MNRIALSLTKLYLRIERAQFVRTTTIQLPDGQESEVIVYASERSFILGQVTVFGTTIIHELVFQRPRLLNYLATHEAAHKQQWYRHFIFPITLFCIPVSIAMSALTLSTLGQSG